MTDQYLGEIRMFAGNYAPPGWAFCHGQLMSIPQNTALFALLGTQYGGNGKTTYALPDLRGRAPMGAGNAPGLGTVFCGESGGTETVTLTSLEIPPHTHAWPVISTAGSAGAEKGGGLSAPLANGPVSYVAGTPLDAALAPNTLLPAGGSQPHSNMMPFLTVNFIIALSGIFPPRD